MAPTARLLALVLLAGTSALAQPIPCEDGFAGEYPCQDVDLLARLPLNATPEFSESSSDLWGWTDPVTGIEYAIINQYDHTAFVDLSTPTAPVVVGTLAAPSHHVARDAKTYADHVFLTTDNAGAPIQVFDLTRLRGVESPPEAFTADTTYDVTTGPHNLALDTASGFAYLVYVDGGECDATLHIVDVRDPQNPTFAGCYAHEPASDFHDAQCITYDGPDSDYAGRELCFGAAPEAGTFAIVDVTDKAAPTLIAETPYPDVGYTHQGWLTEDRRYFLLNDEFDESNYGMNTRTLVFDVEDLDTPEFVFAYSHPTTSTDHNVFVRGDFAYQANYTSGLRILDLSGIDGETLTQAAFFDTHPEDDSTGFDGAFGVYPFFESGIVVVSDMSRGLFVLQPRLDGGTDVETGAAPDDVSLRLYPNPTDDRTTLLLSVGSPQLVRVTVHDMLGRTVATLYEGDVADGEARELALEAGALPAGTYVVRADGDAFSATQTVTVTR